jgi:uncharacterized coiled-coil protein SlyX
MTDDLEGFAQWRDEIETRVGTLEVTIETEASARPMMDGDMSRLEVRLDSQDKLLKALRETQSEQTATLREHGETLRDHTARLERLEAGQAKLEAGQAEVLAGVKVIIGLIDRESGQTTE